MQVVINYKRAVGFEPTMKDICQSSRMDSQAYGQTSYFTTDGKIKASNKNIAKQVVHYISIIQALRVSHNIFMHISNV